MASCIILSVRNYVSSVDNDIETIVKEIESTKVENLVEGLKGVSPKFGIFDGNVEQALDEKYGQESEWTNTSSKEIDQSFVQKIGQSFGTKFNKGFVVKGMHPYKDQGLVAGASLCLEADELDKSLMKAEAFCTKSDGKVKVFEELLDEFETVEIRKYCEEMIKNIPDYIFTMASATSGKYHPVTQCLKYGQIEHILLFGKILNEKLRLEYNIKMTNEFYKDNGAEIRDLMRCAPMLHDALKCGKEGARFTKANHPKEAGDWVKSAKLAQNDISQAYKEFLGNIIEAHSGE